MSSNGPLIVVGALLKKSGACVCPEGSDYREKDDVCVADEGATAAMDGGKKPDGETAQAEAGAEPREATKPSPVDAPQLVPDAGVKDAGSVEPAKADAGESMMSSCVAEEETCDQKDNDCDGVADDGLKNACGKACSVAVPAEDCDTDEDDDCDGESNEERQ